MGAMAAKRTARGKKAEQGDAAAKPARAPRRKKAQAIARAGPRGLPADELAASARPQEIDDLARAIEADGGSVLAIYREPIGGHFCLLAGLPIDRVDPTPFQRDLSTTHVDRLADVIDRLDRYLDPIIAVREGSGYWTPNGHHRLAAVRKLGGRSIVAIVVPSHEVAYRILALNTEKAHNVREKALEVVRMARSLAEFDERSEKELALEFEEPSLLTLGLCYEQRGRFSGGAYHPLLRRIDAFMDEPLPRALAIREERARQLLELDDAVMAAVEALRARGLDSPYLKNFVVSRINPLRFRRTAAPFDETLDQMIAAARRFDASSIEAHHLARAAGPPPEEGA